MSETEMVAELRSLKRRVAELEAANGLRSLAPANEDEMVLSEVCALAGIGMMSVQGESREANVVLKRSVVAKVLRTRIGWTVPRVAKALRKTERAVRKMTHSSC